MPSIVFSSAAIFIAICFGFHGFSSLTNGLKLLLVQLLLAFGAELLGYYIKVEYGNNTVFFNVYFCIDFIVMLFIPASLSYTRKKYLYIPLAVFMVLWFIQVFLTGIGHLANWAFLFGCLILVAVYLFALFRVISDMNSSVTYRRIVTLLCVSVFVFYGAGIPLYSFINYLIAYHLTLAKTIFSINIILEVVRYLIVAYVFYLSKHLYVTSENSYRYES